MQVEHIVSSERFEAMRGEWNELLSASSADTVFLTHEWLRSWWRAYGRGKELHVLAVRSAGGRLIGVAPLYIERLHGLRRVRLLGDGTYDSDYLDFIIETGQEERVASCILQELNRSRREWDVLQWNEIPESSRTLPLLLDLHRISGWPLDRVEVPCGVRELPKTWDAFLQSLRPRFRTSVRSCLRDIDEYGGRFEVLSDKAQISEWLRDLFALHADRWSLRGRSGVFRAQEKRTFYEEMAGEFFARNWLYMTRYRIGSAVLACQFGFVYRGAYHLLQEGFDAQCVHVSPGITLRAATIRDLIAREIRSYDFLGGMGRHKTDWGASTKISLRMALAPPSFSALRYIQAPRALQKAKSLVKALLPARVRERLRDRDKRSDAQATGSAKPQSSASLLVPRIAEWSQRTGALRIARSLGKHFETGSDESPWRAKLRRADTAKVAILCYHRVGIGGIPLYSNLDPEIFEAQMKYLQSHYTLLSLEQWRALRLDPAASGRFVVVTFDDGYRDVYTHAFPVLRRMGIPATIYLTADVIDRNTVAWYDRIFLALKLVATDKFDVLLDKPRRFLLSTWPSRLRAAEEIIAYLRRIPAAERVAFCEDLERRVPLPADQIVDRMLSWGQLEEMKAGGIAFGSHSMTHPALSQLQHGALEHELRGSKRILESRLKTVVEDFAYPFGKREDCGSVPEIMARFGYRTAVTTHWGVNVSRTDPFRLRRVSICDEPHLPTFALRLTQLFLEPGADDGARPIPDAGNSENWAQVRTGQEALDEVVQGQTPSERRE